MPRGVRGASAAAHKAVVKGELEEERERDKARGRDCPMVSCQTEMPERERGQEREKERASSVESEHSLLIGDERTEGELAES